MFRMLTRSSHRETIGASGEADIKAGGYDEVAIVHRYGDHNSDLVSVARHCSCRATGICAAGFEASPGRTKLFLRRWKICEGWRAPVYGGADVCPAVLPWQGYASLAGGDDSWHRTDRQ